MFSKPLIIKGFTMLNKMAAATPLHTNSKCTYKARVYTQDKENMGRGWGRRCLSRNNLCTLIIKDKHY